MTLLFIRKAATPPAAPTPPSNNAPAAKTQPAKVGRPKEAGPDLSNAQWVSKKDYPDGPPAGMISETDQGYYIPKGAATPQHIDEDEGEEVTDDEVSDVEPPSPPNATPHDPQDATDPLKNDDGSAHGTEQLDADPFGINEVLAGENAQPAGAKTLAPDKFATQADTRQTQILQNIAQQTGATPSIKEVRSIPLAERDVAGIGGASKPVSKQKGEKGMSLAERDARNHREARKGKEFKLPDRNKKKKAGGEPAPNKTMAAKPGAKRDGVDPFAKTEFDSSSKEAPKSEEAKAKAQTEPPKSAEAKTQVDSTEDKVDKVDKVKARREKADSSRKKSTTKDIKETKKRAAAHEKAKEKHARNKASSTEKLTKLKEKRQVAKKASSDNDKEVKSIGKDLDKVRKELKSAEKGSFEHKQATKKLDDLNGKLMVANAKSVGHKQALADLDEKEGKVKQGLKDSEQAISDSKKAHDEMKDHHDKELPESPADKLTHKEHTEKAKKQLEVIDAHIDADPDNEDLWNLREVFAEQANIEHVPGSDDKSALNRGASFSKNKGVDKHPDEIKAEKDATDQKEAEKQAKTEATAKKQEETAQKKQAAAEEKAKQKAKADALKQQKKDNPDEKRSKASSGRSSSAMSSYNSGGSVGSRIGALGTKGGATQAISLAADVPKGAVSAGHHLLARKKEEKKEETPEVDPKDDPLKKDDPDQKKAVTKSMKLYIKKAIGQTPNASINSSDKSPEENEEDHESSYKKRTIGVMGGDASEDTKGSGRKMNEPHKSVKKGEK